MCSEVAALVCWLPSESSMHFPKLKIYLTWEELLKFLEGRPDPCTFSHCDWQCFRQKVESRPLSISRGGRARSVLACSIGCQL